MDAWPCGGIRGPAGPTGPGEDEEGRGPERGGAGLPEPRSGTQRQAGLALFYAEPRGAQDTIGLSGRGNFDLPIAGVKRRHDLFRAPGAIRG